VVSAGPERKRTAGDERDEFAEKVGRSEERKIRSRKSGGEREVWFGLGMFGLVGWSVAIPTVIGIAVGVWLDNRYPAGTVSWTLTFLVLGIVLGCLNAWFWVSRERREIERDREDGDGEK